MNHFSFFILALLFVFSQSLAFGQCQNCFEGPTTVFAGQTAYYYWGGTPGGVWYVTNATPGVIGTPSQSSEVLSIPIIGQGGFTVTHDNANGTQVNVVAWSVPGPPDNPYIQSRECGHVVISMRTQNKPGDVDWYWIDGRGNFVSISPSLDIYENGTYYLQSRSHDHPEITGGTSGAINVTMPQRPVDGVILANSSRGPVTICAGDPVTISSVNGIGSPFYWASSNGMSTWNVFSGMYEGRDSFTFKTDVAGTYDFQVRNKTELCKFCWDAGNTCAPGSSVRVIVMPRANPGELFVNNADANVCVGTRIPVRLLNNVGTAHYNIYYTRDTDNDGKPNVVSVEDDARLGTSFEYTLYDYGEWTFEYWSDACEKNSDHRTSTISVWAPPSAPLFGADPLVCEGDSTKIHVTPGYPGTGVRWYNAPSATVPLNRFPYTADFSTGRLTQSKSYWVASYRSFGATSGCEGTRYQYSVTVTPRPVDSDITASATSICVGETVRISASGGVGTKHFYCSSNGGLSWNIFEDGYKGTTQFDHTPQAPGTYRYHVRNSTACGYCGSLGNNCNGEKYVIVIVTDPPVAGNVVGQKNVLFGQPYDYSCPQASLNASTFNWEVIGGTVLSGQGTRSVKAMFTQAGGRISVKVGRGLCTAITVPSLTVAEGGNYVVEENVEVKGITDPAATYTLDENAKSKNTTFYDGLGRPIQTVNWRATPQRNDIVVPNVYDKFGREPVKYLPFSGGNNGYYKPDPVGSLEIPYSKSPQRQYYDGRTPGIAIDDSPHMKTVFELSPLNRVLKQGAAGKPWQPDETGNDDMTIEKKYMLNTVKDVFRFEYNAATASILVDASGYYAANELLANKSFDEHNNETIEFIDKLGHIVCKKVQYTVGVGVKKYACTYYLYDDFGNLVVVLPPEAVKQILEKN